MRFILIILYSVSVLSAQDMDKPTIDDILSVKTMGDLQLSPDRRQLAFRLTTPLLDENRYQRDIYVMEVASGNVRQMTTNDASDYGPVWSPDGKSIVFISTRQNGAQLWKLNMDGGEAQQLTDLPQGAGHPVFSRDGGKIAFLATEMEYFPPQDQEVYTALEDRGSYNRIWVLDLATKETEMITRQPYLFLDMDWSPDGTQLAVAFDTVGTDAVSEDHYVGLLDVENGELEFLTETGRQNNHPRWSPDGDKLAWIGCRSKPYGAYLTMTDVWMWDRESSTITNLTGPAQINIGDDGSLASFAPVWSADGSAVYFYGASGAASHIYRVELSDRVVLQVSNCNTEIHQFALDIAGEKVYFSGSRVDQPYEIFSAGFGDRISQKLSDYNHFWGKYPLSGAEEISYPSTNGYMAHGWLIKPWNYSKTNRYPLVVDLHGGPAWRWANAWGGRYLWHVWSSEGYAIFLANPRGSSGYGERYLRGNYKDFGGGDLEDVLNGVNYLVHQGIADSDNLFVTGYSYGGFLTNAAVSQTDRFNAAVSIAGAFDFVSNWAQTNPVLMEVYYGMPWENPDDYARSPLSRIENIKTPILLIHPKEDRAVHYMQGVEFFTFLQKRGVPSELRIYPDEGHSINQPDHMRDYLQRTWEWFEQYRKD